MSRAEILIVSTLGILVGALIRFGYGTQIRQMEYFNERRATDAVQPTVDTIADPDPIASSISDDDDTREVWGEARQAWIPARDLVPNDPSTWIGN
jgi:hypothetical protein